MDKIFAARHIHNYYQEIFIYSMQLNGIPFANQSILSSSSNISGGFGHLFNKRLGWSWICSFDICSREFCSCARTDLIPFGERIDKTCLWNIGWSLYVCSLLIINSMIHNWYWVGCYNSRQSIHYTCTMHGKLDNLYQVAKLSINIHVHINIGLKILQLNHSDHHCTCKSIESDETKMNRTELSPQQCTSSWK